MHFLAEPTGDGFALRIEGQNWNADPCRMIFPGDVWASFSAKDALVRELVYVNTLAIPMILKHPRVRFSTPCPRYLDLYHELFKGAIPNLVEDIPTDDADEILGRFRSIAREFADGAETEVFRPGIGKGARRVVLPFSFGKDSLLTLAVLREMGYEVFPVLIDERVLPRGFSIKQSMIGDLVSDFGLELRQVVNEIQILSDYEVLEKPPTRLYQVQAYFIYVLAMLPFCEFFDAPLIALNNEYANSLNFMHRQGYLSPIKAMQSDAATRRLGRMVEDFTGGRVAVINPIGVLGNFAIHRLLHEAYPEYGKFRISCHMEVNEFSRWCHDCERCAHACLFFKACGRDPMNAGFEQSMLTERTLRRYRIFSPRHPRDEYRKNAAEEESLAFAVLNARGGREPLVERFARDISPGLRVTKEKLAGRVFTLRARPRHPVEKAAARVFAKKIAALPPL